MAIDDRRGDREPAAATGAEHPDHRFDRALGARLRAVRSQQHLSLQGVERKSEGRWKAVVVGSYERGDRAISVHRLAELAAFYEVPVTELLPDGAADAPGTPVIPLTKVVLNARRVLELDDPDAEPLVRLVTAILHRRRQSASDRLATERLQIRSSDLISLAMLYDTTPEAITERLVRWQVLAPDSVILDGEP